MRITKQPTIDEGRTANSEQTIRRQTCERRIPSGRCFTRRRGAAALATLLLCGVLLGCCSAAAFAAPVLDPELFPIPPELEPNIAFWTKVYARYDSQKVLLHDDLHLNVIYTVLDFSALEKRRLSDHRLRLERRRAIEQAKAKYRSILEDSAAGRVSDSYPAEQARVEAMFARVPGGREKYAAATRRLRNQTCVRDRFAEGIERSGLYLPMIEQVFAARGLPLELSRLPFVESLFHTGARSTAAAGGIWQFIPTTGRLFLKMELEYDERFDPYSATEAAASLLEKNYQVLKSWPVAITAYNHGTNGMLRAVRQLGTRDLGVIAYKYRSRTFGFASRNFYAEFVAASRVYAEREKYFPGVAPKPPLRAEVFRPGEYVAVRSLAAEAGVDLDELKRHNPALSSQVWTGHLFVPKDYPLLVPQGKLAAFETAFAGLPADRRSPRQVGFHYRVRSGDTLASIAGKFGTSVRSLQRSNKISNPHRIRIGQRLLIPPSPSRRGSSAVAAAPPAVAVAQSTPPPEHHVVRSGESLSSIARRYGTTVSALQLANSLRSPDRISVGQRLRVPNGNGVTHVVRRGETLAKIARRYGVSVSELKSANSIRSHIIRPSQVLLIPCARC